MSARTLAATAFAAMSLVSASPLAAADLDYPDDSRYSESEHYSNRVTDDRGERYESYSRREAYVDDDRSDVRWDDRAGCLPRHAIRERLRDDGWRDIQRVEVRGGTVVMSAVRPNGQLFDIKVDRCNGEIIDARKTGGEVYGEYRPRRDYRY